VPFEARDETPRLAVALVFVIVTGWSSGLHW
jgi:hypothetical protein